MWMFNLFSQRVNASLPSRLIAGVLILLVLSFFAASHAEEDFLAPEKAFQFSAKMVDVKTAEVTYKIADGYYMYRERFVFKADGAKLGEAIIPPGKIKFDETFQKNVESHRGILTIRIPVDASSDFTL